MLISFIPLFFLLFQNSLQSNLDIFCDDYCEAIYINNVYQNIQLETEKFQRREYTINARIGELITIVLTNEISKIGLAFSTEIDSKTFSSNDLAIVSWNSSKDFIESYYDYVKKEFPIYNFLANDGNPYEAREVYIQLSDNLGYRSRNVGVIQNSFVQFFYTDSIEYIDPTYNKDNIKEWEFILIEPPKYGEIYLDGNGVDRLNEKSEEVQNAYYKAVTPLQREIIKFKFRHKTSGIESPITIINIIICDEGCEICDENDYKISIEERICIKCLANMFKYRNRCYKQCPDYLYSIESELKCVKQCDETPYLYYSGQKCVSTCESNDFLYEDTNTCYSSCPLSLYAIEETKKCVAQCDLSPYLPYSPLSFPPKSQKIDLFG